MNKNLLLAGLALTGVLLAANFYFMNTPAPGVEPNTGTPLVDKTTSTGEPVTVRQTAAPPAAPVATQPPSLPNTTGSAQKAPEKQQRDHKHDTSWQKPDYQPTETEQAREAILAGMTPEDQRQTRADLFQMSLYYRSPEDVNKAIEAAREKGKKETVERLERFRQVAFPND